jgi:hypothetical protein
MQQARSFQTELQMGDSAHGLMKHLHEEHSNQWGHRHHQHLRYVSSIQGKIGIESPKT